MITLLTLSVSLNPYIQTIQYNNHIFKLQQKYMKSYRSESGETAKQQAKIYNKIGCQLTEFPIIKLHILQNIQIIDLSNNLICDLSALKVHKGTCQHVLAKLKAVDLSNNQIASASSLIPLAQAAMNLKQLKITANPLTLTLNFLYQLVIIFKQITQLTYSNTLIIDNDFRIKMVEFQLKGAHFISRFMKKVYHLTLHASKMGRSEQFVGRIKDIAMRLQTHQHSILEHNSTIFHAIREFLQIPSFVQNSQAMQYESPIFIKGKAQIDAISQYKISNRFNNHLTRYLSQQSENDQHTHSPISKQKHIIQFYYSQMLKNADIQRKLLQEVQIEEEVNKRLERGQCEKFDRTYLGQLLQEKWQKQTEYTFHQFPETNLHIGTALASSPFKSVNTETTSTQGAFTSMLKRDEGGFKQYFGLDREWTVATHQFISHRLVSLHKQLKTTSTTSHQQYGSNNLKNDYYCNIKSTGFVSQQNIQKYLTFGYDNNQQKLNEFKIDSDYSEEDSLDFRNEVSPKSKNKYIIATCLSNLAEIVKKIVFRRIRDTVTIKPAYLSFFQHIVHKAEERILEFSLRKIGKYALFVDYLQNKMRKFKLQQIFKKWRLLKKRKEKLMKTLIKRKMKKEGAFLSVIMTQWRVTASHMRLEQNMRRKREMLSVDAPISQMSGILVRSATQHKLGSQRWKSRYGLGVKLSRRQL